MTESLEAPRATAASVARHPFAGAGEADAHVSQDALRVVYLATERPKQGTRPSVRESYVMGEVMSNQIGMHQKRRRGPYRPRRVAWLNLHHRFRRWPGAGQVYASHTKLGKYFRFDPSSEAFQDWLRRHEVGVDTGAA